MKSNLYILDVYSFSSTVSEMKKMMLNVSDILESYSRSPFLAPDADFLDSREREPQGEYIFLACSVCRVISVETNTVMLPLAGDSRRLDTISEGLSFEEFGSE